MTYQNKPINDPDEVLRRMLNTPPSSDSNRVTLKMVKELTDRVLQQNAFLPFRAAEVRSQLSTWMADPTCFETESAKALAEHFMLFLEQK